MKITLTFKMPDVLDQLNDQIDPKTDDELIRAKEIAEQYVSYGEYVTIELDTETGTAEVLKVED
ncbi:hypothetical protein ACFLQL_00485 [Verrucomicrobiota bacterium]